MATWAWVAKDARLLGAIAVSDPIKPTSAEAVQRFKAMGLRTLMVSGDNRAAAEAIGRVAGIDDVRAETLPKEKADCVSALQKEKRHVAMIGDGINDAPALAQADVGLAIGAGTDIAIEAAGVTLMRSDLNDAALAVEIARKTMRTIRQNLFFAFIYNVAADSAGRRSVLSIHRLAAEPDDCQRRDGVQQRDGRGEQSAIARCVQKLKRGVFHLIPIVQR